LKRNSGFWITTCLITLLFFCLLSGCDPKSEGIVVLENKDIAYNKFTIEGTDIYPQVYAVDWINEHTVLDSRFRLYHLKNKKAYFLVFDRNAREPLVSPDKQYLFYRISKRNQLGNYYMLHLPTEKKIVLPIKEQVLQPSWVDNKTILFMTGKGETFSVNIFGQIAKINDSFQAVKEEEGYTSHLVRVGEQFFYLDGAKLMVWNQTTNEKKQLMDNVYDMVLSPDKTTFAIEKLIPKDPNDKGKESFVGLKVLMLMDTTGKQQKIVAQSNEIMGLNWSGDSQKLSYLIWKSYATNQTELHIADIRKGEISILATNIQSYNKQIKWSPSGNKVLVNGLLKIDTPEQRHALYILHLKHSNK
jgi:Tol biopolymer transport system component